MYMIRYLRISSYIRKPFLISYMYDFIDFAPDPIYVNFLISEKKMLFSFLSERNTKTLRLSDVATDANHDTLL
jgi:hypothetical protein